jgi:hypothetical protein
VVSLGPAVISLIGSKPGDYYEDTYPRSDSLLFNVHGSCRSLTCLSRLGTGRSHHVPVHRKPLHRRDRPLQHERFRDGYGDAGGPTRSEHAAHSGHSYRFYIVRWGANNNQQWTRHRFFLGIPIRYGRIRGDQYVEGCGGDDIRVGLAPGTAVSQIASRLAFSVLSVECLNLAPPLGFTDYLTPPRRAGVAELADAPDLGFRNHRFQNVSFRFQKQSIYEGKRDF